jgi:cytochrome c6
MRLSNVPLVAGVMFALVSTGSAKDALASEASGQRVHFMSARAGHSPDPGSSARAADRATVEAGASVYGDYCSSCHGEQLRNTSGGVTFDLRKLGPEDRDRFAKAVLDGKGPMPPWRGVLKPEQIEAIWAYIRATATVDR